MFSATTDCQVNSWNIDKIFQNPEFEEDNKEKKKSSLCDLKGK